MSEKMLPSMQVNLVDALSKIENALKQLRNLDEARFKVGSPFYYAPSSNKGISVPDATLTQCREMTAFLIGKIKHVEDADIVLGIQNETIPVYKWCGATPEDWIHDLRLRVDILLQSSKREALLKYKKVLDDNMDKETRLAKMMKEMSDTLGFEL